LGNYMGMGRASWNFSCLYLFIRQNVFQNTLLKQLLYI
jgi:hypothetical protein